MNIIAQIETLEKEVNRLEFELDAAKARNRGRDVVIRELKEERTQLKAEINKLKQELEHYKSITEGSIIWNSEGVQTIDQEGVRIPVLYGHTEDPIQSMLEQPGAVVYVLYATESDYFSIYANARDAFTEQAKRNKTESMNNAGQRVFWEVKMEEVKA